MHKDQGDLSFVLMFNRGGILVSYQGIIFHGAWEIEKRKLIYYFGMIVQGGRKMGNSETNPDSLTNIPLVS